MSLGYAGNIDVVRLEKGLELCKFRSILRQNAVSIPSKDFEGFVFID